MATPDAIVLYNDVLSANGSRVPSNGKWAMETVAQVEKIMGAEDFSRYRFGPDDQDRIPIFMFSVGATDAKTLARACASGKLPTTHQNTFAPLPEPTVLAGIKAMTSAVLELLKK